MKIEIDGISIPIDHFRKEDYEAVAGVLRLYLGDLSCKNRDAIKKAFDEAVKRGPSANPSDLWHHVVYRLYTEIAQDPKIVERRGRVDPGQSWKRASGDAFELFLVDYYNCLLAGKGIRLIPLMSSALQESVQRLFGIYGEIGGSKLDIAVVCHDEDVEGLFLRQEDLIGVIHAKVSLAERVSDDIPASRALMEKGYVSLLVTLDVKSFPLSSTVQRDRAYINRGELGTPDKPTDKRRYIEEQGEFDICFSFNCNTVPSPPETSSGKKIVVIRKLDGQWDSLCDTLFAARSMQSRHAGT